MNDYYYYLLKQLLKKRSKGADNKHPLFFIDVSGLIVLLPT